MRASAHRYTNKRRWKPTNVTPCSSDVMKSDFIPPLSKKPSKTKPKTENSVENGLILNFVSVKRKFDVTDSSQSQSLGENHATLDTNFFLVWNAKKKVTETMDN